MGFLVVCFSSSRVQATEWYESGQIISHAGGGIKKKTYTNSREALQKTLSKGRTLVELDFTFTKDGVLVCRHGWSDRKKGRQSLKSFLKKKTAGGYTPMTAQDALEMIASVEGVYLIVDTQEKSLKKVYTAIVNLCVSMERPELLERIIPQIYHQSDYDKVNSVYNFPNWIYSLYKEKIETKKQYKKLAKFCNTHNIKVVTIEYERVTKSRVKILKKAGLVCMVHTVNKKSIFKKLKKLGVYGIYSDFL